MKVFEAINAINKSESVVISDVSTFWKTENYINITIKGDATPLYIQYSNTENRDKDFDRFTNLIKEEKTNERKYMNYFKDYFSKHRDAIFTLGLILLVDHFVFNGAFRVRIQQMVESLLNKTHKQLEKGLSNE